MPAQYEICFTIRGGDGVGGVQLLREATERITGELVSSTADAAADEGAPDVETGATELSGYTRISAERNYPADPQYRVRLEVRLCTGGNGDLEAEVHSRFLSTTEAAPPELLAGPPRLFQFIMGEFQCAAGTEPLPWLHRYVARNDAESFACESVLNSQRRLPILALSEDRNGILALDPARAQRSLLGVASVAVLAPGAATELTRYLGRWFSSSSGALQILWPGSRVDTNGDGPRIFYFRDAAARKGVPELLRELQQVCICNAPESDFDSAFSEARVSVILERNRLLEAQQAVPAREDADQDSTLKSTKRELRKAQVAAGEDNRKWQNAMATVARLEQELAAANDVIAELSAPPSGTVEPQDEREITRQLRAETRELREERDKLRETNDRLNDDNQLLRQQERQLSSVNDAYVIRLANPHPGNVTVLNHALNLYRDPMRHYIISNLGTSDEAGLKEILRMSVEFNPTTRERPESLIDVNDFHNVVSDNRTYFEDRRNLAWNLRQIKDVRNKAAHPPPGGISDDYTQDGLTRIAEALDAIGANQEHVEVSRLRDKIHAN